MRAGGSVRVGGAGSGADVGVGWVGGVRREQKVAHLAPLLAQLVAELDDQDAVLGDQPDQGDEADLAVDVERAAGQVHGPQGAHDGQRHRQGRDECGRKAAQEGCRTRVARS